MVLLHARLAVRTQHHRLPSHLPGHRRGRGALVGDLLARSLKDAFGGEEFVPLGPHVRQLLFELIQFRGPLSTANLGLLGQEIQQIDELVGKCEADISSLTHGERTTVESWLHSRDRFLTVIPVAAVLAGRQRLAQPTVDPTLTERMTG
ncbi:hypothetical protein [Streptomyces goshikiensis]|uniref:hypothetical protein n=1 Tax=Streptomyces goshikiensis TaxID=1942 RepID=UPI00369D3BC9